MACIQLLKSSPSNYHVKFESGSSKGGVRLRNSGAVLDRRRLRFSCKYDDRDNPSKVSEISALLSPPPPARRVELVNNCKYHRQGGEPPESLFMKELRRRGMSPASLLEEKKKSGERTEEVKFREEDGGWTYSRTNGVRTDAEMDLSNQREKSMALNSEGLEGLIPRAKLLITLGGTFFLAFWPLILVTVASFTAVYLYFGPQFVHDGSNTPINYPQYVDPYALLEGDKIYKTAPLNK